MGRQPVREASAYDRRQVSRDIKRDPRQAVALCMGMAAVTAAPPRPCWTLQLGRQDVGHARFSPLSPRHLAPLDGPDWGLGRTTTLTGCDRLPPGPCRPAATGGGTPYKPLRRSGAGPRSGRSPTPPPPAACMLRCCCSIKACWSSGRLRGRLARECSLAAGPMPPPPTTSPRCRPLGICGGRSATLAEPIPPPPPPPLRACRGKVPARGCNGTLVAQPQNVGSAGGRGCRAAGTASSRRPSKARRNRPYGQSAARSCFLAGSASGSSGLWRSPAAWATSAWTGAVPGSPASRCPARSAQSR